MLSCSPSVGNGQIQAERNAHRAILSVSFFFVLGSLKSEPEWRVAL